jgi:hypothetical protein
MTREHTAIRVAAAKNLRGQVDPWYEMWDQIDCLRCQGSSLNTVQKKFVNDVVKARQGRQLVSLHMTQIYDSYVNIFGRFDCNNTIIAAMIATSVAQERMRPRAKSHWNRNDFDSSWTVFWRNVPCIWRRRLTRFSSRTFRAKVIKTPDFTNSGCSHSFAQVTESRYSSISQIPTWLHKGHTACGS